jgi:hypothetical protein
VKDRRSQLEGGEWEPIKIPHENLAYVPKSTWRASLVARPRPHSYWEAIGSQKRVRNRNHSEKYETVQSRVTSETTIVFSPHKHFIKHLVGVFEKQPWEFNENKENSSLLSGDSRTKPISSHNQEHESWTLNSRENNRRRRKPKVKQALYSRDRIKA